MAMLLPTAALPAATAAIYGVAGLLVAASLRAMFGDFSAQAGLASWVAITAPALFAGLYALLLYQGAVRMVERPGQSVSRGVLIALLTWLSFSLLAAWGRCGADAYEECLSTTLVASGALGGGPLLIGMLIAGYVCGKLIEHHRPLARMRDEEA